MCPVCLVVLSAHCRLPSFAPANLFHWPSAASVALFFFWRLAVFGLSSGLCGPDRRRKARGEAAQRASTMADPLSSRRLFFSPVRLLTTGTHEAILFFFAHDKRQ
nr:hypothetical protein [Pandoravirus aubagnensis]